MKCVRGVALVALAIVGLALLPSVTLAAELGTAGEALQIEGLNGIFATIWSYLSGPAGKIIAAFLIGSGFAHLGTDNTRKRPAMELGGGAGFAAVPWLVNSSFEATPAADGVLPALASPALEVLRGFLGASLIKDPLFYAIFGMTLLAVALARSRQSALALR